jgi:Thioredoxin-like
MMSRMITVIGLTLFAFAIKSQPISHKQKSSFFVSVQLEGDPLTDSLQIYFKRNVTLSQSQYDGVFSTVPLKKDLPVNLTIPDIASLGRLTLYCRELSLDDLLEEVVVEPGDSIIVKISRLNNEVTLNFKGRQEHKYNTAMLAKVFRAKWREIEDSFNRNELHIDKAISMTDSVFQLYKKLLDVDREKLTPLVYKTWIADMIGQRDKMLLRLFSNAYADGNDILKEELIIKIKKLINSKPLKNYKEIGLSKDYIECMYEKTKWQLVFERNKSYKKWEYSSYNNSFGLMDLYQRLKLNYSGELKEYLLAYSLLNPRDINIFFGGCQPEMLTWCLNDALKIVHTSILQVRLKDRLAKFGQGAKAFDFSLSDANNEIVRLSDFKGKLVLIDIWSEGCMACTDFKEEFERKIFSFIHGRDDFKVISIGTESDTNKWMSLLNRYSHTDFISLHFKEGGLSHPLMKYYDVSFIPFILLVDKNGKIISSTLRDCDQLLKLIRSQLQL